MPAVITGIVFHDLNHNDQYDPGGFTVSNGPRVLTSTVTAT